MGLDTTHGAWHGSYSSFNQFRRWLASQIGVNLDEYMGYGKETATKRLKEIHHLISPLLNHSDCDGILTPKECRDISVGLKDILEKVEINDRTNYYYQAAIDFRKGCIRAANAKENLEFH